MHFDSEPACVPRGVEANSLGGKKWITEATHSLNGVIAQEASAMNSRPLVVTASDRGTTLTVVGTNVTVLVSDTDSSDQQITLQSGDEGTGPPPHSHDWCESFYVTRGQVQFTYSGQTMMCVAGTLVHVPPGVVHSFSYGPGGGEMLEVTGRGSKAVQMFSALDREIPPGPPDVPKVIQVAGEYGVKFHI